MNLLTGNKGLGNKEQLFSPLKQLYKNTTFVHVLVSSWCVIYSLLSTCMGENLPLILTPCMVCPRPPLPPQSSPNHPTSPPPLWPLIRSDLRWRYGSEAGQATDHAVNSAINVGLTAFNIDNLGIKAVAKRTGKQTAQALLEDYKIQERPDGDKQVAKLDK